MRSLNLYIRLISDVRKLVFKSAREARRAGEPLLMRINHARVRDGDGSVARYHGTAAAPRYAFLYGTSTVALTVLFSTAIPQVLRFFGTVFLVRC